MKFPTFPIIGTLLLSANLAVHAQSDITPPDKSKTATPTLVDPEQIAEDPFRYNGLVTIGDTFSDKFSSGSGFCAWNRKTFFTAAHVVYSNNKWIEPPKYFPSANSLKVDNTIAIQSRGYYRWTNYATLSDASNALVPTPGQLEFGRDVVLAFAFTPVISGKPAMLNLNGLAVLKTNVKSLITGYPKDNLYINKDIDGFYMYKTERTEKTGNSGSLPTLYTKFAGNALQTTLLTTGHGNSGGPVWTKNKNEEWVAAGVLVGGRPSESIVYAFSKDTNSLLQAVSPVIKAKIQKPRGSSSISSFTTFFPCLKIKKIPDGVQRWTTFPIPVNTFSGDSTVVSVKLSLDIRTAHQGDLVIELISPGGLKSAVVHNEGGANKVNLILTDVNFSQAFSTTKASGQWQLRVQDRLKGDVATFKSAVLEIGAFDPVDVVPTP